MSKRQVFFSFEFNKDVWRAGQVRNMGKISDDSTFSDNEWEEVKTKDTKIIKNGLITKWQCALVLWSLLVVQLQHDLG